MVLSVDKLMRNGHVWVTPVMRVALNVLRCFSVCGVGWYRLLRDRLNGVGARTPVLCNT